MTQAGATPQPSGTPTPTTTNVPLQTLTLLKQIAERPQNPDKPQGGVVITYTDDEIRGTFGLSVMKNPFQGLKPTKRFQEARAREDYAFSYEKSLSGIETTKDADGRSYGDFQL
jgi:hypothetical protein